MEHDHQFLYMGRDGKRSKPMSGCRHGWLHCEADSGGPAYADAPAYQGVAFETQSDFQLTQPTAICNFASRSFCGKSGKIFTSFGISEMGAVLAASLVFQDKT
jgi:hypothetical protein